MSRLLTAIAFLAWLGVGHAEAAPPLEPVVLVPVTEGTQNLSSVASLARAVSVELEQMGLEHLAPQDARRLFLERVSRNPQAVEQDVLDRLPEIREKIRAANTEGRFEDARRHTQELMRIASQALEAIDLKEEHAREAKLACVVLADLMLRQGNRYDAVRQARECEARWPHIPVGHLAAETVALLEEARTHLREDTVTVQVTSYPSGCDVYIEGFSVGPTPHVRTFPAGVPRRVQVQCGKASTGGRVHVVAGNEDTSLHINTHFEQSLDTSGKLLRLEYERLDDSRLLAHARKIAISLRQSSTLLVLQKSPDALELRLVTPTHAATTEVAVGYTAEEIRQAWRRLQLALHPEENAAARMEEAPALEAPNATRDKRRARLWSGLGLSVVGGALTGLGWWQHRTRADEGLQFRSLTFEADGTPPPEYLPLADSWRAMRFKPYTLSTFGAVAAGAGVPLALLPVAEAHYFVSILSAAGGAGLLAAASVWLRRGSSCDADSAPNGDLRRCVLAEERLDRGALLLLASVPLLSLPLTHLTRYLLGRRATASVSLGPSAGRIALTLTL